MEARDQITEQFREAVRKKETEAVPSMDTIWERVEMLLDNDKEEDKKSVIPFRKISLAAALLLLLGLTAVYFIRYSTADTSLVRLSAAGSRPLPERQQEVVAIVGEDKPEGAVVSNPVKKHHRYTNVPKRTSTDRQQQPVAITDTRLKGRVVDENGAPVPGALIRIKGLRQGTVTDINGDYEIEVNGLQTLELSGIGMQGKEIDSKFYPDSMLVTTLSYSRTALNEVAIVAPYDRLQTKTSYLGSATVIKEEKISKRPRSKVAKVPYNYTPGIAVINGNGQPGTTAGIRIRGTGSVSTKGSSPLVIVDGVPYSGDVMDIDSRDVKTISILKDAAATSLYGSRSANGVLIITTKSGKGYKVKTGIFKKIKNLFRKKENRSSMVLPAATPEQTAITGETYEPFIENPFEVPVQNPRSTFSIDVDNAAYTNIRRLINNGQAVPHDAVRVEEMINFFSYKYPQPTTDAPFSINTDYSDAPWNNKHKLLRIGLQGRIIPVEKLPPSNLVFLIDVSGSMNEPNKLPLLQASMKLLVTQLRKEDKVAIVVYAGAAGLILPATAGDKKADICQAIDQLQAGGSTAGGQGIELAYRIAQEHFIKNGNNRVILATDGDFNVGASSDADMKSLIEQKRKSNIFLTCLGYGMGNYKDSKMEVLADKGNGNYAYIDNLQEANRFLVKEFSGTMYAIAKDVKVQIEFNPMYVQSYRLIGYENRKLATADFTNDRIDAGELGSGHTVTALYEVIPVGVVSDYTPKQRALKNKPLHKVFADPREELATVKFRYKKPDGDKSIELVHVIDHKPIPLSNAAADFKLASAVAWFGLKLRDSKLVPDKSQQAILKLATQAVPDDRDGYRAEFVRLVEAVH